MSTAHAIRAGRAFVELFADDKRLAAGLKRAEARLRAFATSARQIGANMFAAGAAASAPFGLSLKVFATFEQQMSRVAAITGATGDKLLKLENLAKRLGAETVYSATQAAEAMTFFALAGFSVDEIVAAMAPTLDLAAAGMMDVGNAADIAIKVFRGMGLETKDFGHAIDVLTKGMTTANTDLYQLGDAMKYVGPVAKTAGYSIEETVAAVQLLSDAGIQADMAGTTLRGAILSLTDPSKEAKELLDSLGVSINDASGDVRPLADIVDDLNRSLKGMGTGQRLGVIGRIFDARQAAGFAQLMLKGGNALRSATKELEKSDGTAKKIAAIQLDNLLGDVTILLSALEALQIQLGEALEAPVRDAVKYITKVVNYTTKWVKENQGLVRSIAAIAATVLGVGVALLALSAAASLLSYTMGGMALVVALSFRAYRFIIPLIKTGFTWLIRFLVASGQYILTTVVNIGRSIYTLFTQYTAIGAVLFSSIVSQASIFYAEMSRYMDATAEAVTYAVNWMSQQFDWLKDVTTKTWTAIGNALVKGDILLAAKVLWVGLKLVWEKGIYELNSQWLNAKYFFQTTWSEATNSVAKKTVNSWAGLESGWTETVGFLADAWGIFTSFLTKSWNTTIGFIQKAWIRLKSLFDKDINVKAEVEKINKDTQEKNEKVDDDLNKKILEREESRKKRQLEIENNRQGSIAVLNEDQARQNAEREKKFLSDTEASRKALADARAEWQKAVDEANAPELKKDERSISGYDPKKRRSGQLADAQKGLQEVSDKVTSQGTFSAAAIRGFGAGLEDRIAKATEDTAKWVKKSYEQDKVGGKFK